MKWQPLYSKNIFQKLKPRDVIERSNLNKTKHKKKLQLVLWYNEGTIYHYLKNVFLQVLNKHAPCKPYFARTL